MHVRFAPKAGKRADVSLCPLCAISGSTQVTCRASLGSDAEIDRDRWNGRTRVALLRRGSSKFGLWRGNNSLRRLHDEEDFGHRCNRHIADKRRDRCAGAIQSESDGGHRHGGEPRTDPVRSLHPWVSRVCALAALAPPMALVSPALVICRNGLQRRYCNQLMSLTTGSGQARHTGALSLSAIPPIPTELMRRTETSRCANSGRSASQQNAIPTVEATFIADGGRPCRGENQRTHRQILAAAR